MIASNCVIVNGAKKSILLDLQREKYYELTEVLTSILSKKFFKSWDNLNNQEEEFLKFLIEEEVLVLIPESTIEMFPTLDTSYHSSASVSNFIIELSLLNIEYSNRILKDLNTLGCVHLEVRVCEDISFIQLLDYLALIKDTTIEIVDIFLPFIQGKIENIEKLKVHASEVRWIYIYSAPIKDLATLNKKRISNTLYIKQNIDASLCGNISPFYFSINIATFNESKSYNSCLNCKISVDRNGKIKNCPSMNFDYGSIEADNLSKIILNKKYIKYQSIKKDDIKVCKDCEYRYICTDCRAFIEDPQDLKSKPLKCKYNPYTGVWEK